MNEYQLASHEVGKCPAGHDDCDGIPTFGPNPFSLEVYDDDTPEWACDGVRYEQAMDI